MIYTFIYVGFNLSQKAFLDQLNFISIKWWLLTAAPPYPLTWTAMLSLESFSDHFWSFFTPRDEVFGVTIAEVDSGVDDISLLVKRVLLVLVENTWPPFCCTFYTACVKLGY